MRVKILLTLLLLPLLGGCDQMRDLLELPNPEKESAAAEADARAVGSACRQAGRSLEDCYLLNSEANKASVFAGWREMNDYMQENNLPVVPSKMLQPGELPPWPRSGPGIPPHPDAATPAPEPENTTPPSPT